MLTELERRASEAWKLMTRQPNILDTIVGCEAMPAGVALDYVQEPTGDRDDAVTALVNAGADWLDGQTVPSDGTEVSSTCIDASDMVRSYIRSECFGLAEVHLSHIRGVCYLARSNFGITVNERWAVTDWGRWANKALHVIDHCRAVVAAAYPEEVPLGEKTGGN
jgi:hypothetical protein